MFRVHAYNASGDTLFFAADADGADHLEDLTAGQAYDVMATRKSGHRWNDDTQRFTRNRIAYFRLVHATGHAERITPAEAVAVVSAAASVEPAAATTAAPVVPTVLPGQRVRITGGRFAGIETTPSEVQASGWLRFTTNARRGYGIERQNVAPGNWEPVPYSTGLHEFAPEAGGTICVTPCLRPNGTVQACGDPVHGAIHDPQAHAAYLAELAAELARFAAAPAVELDAPAPAHTTVHMVTQNTITKHRGDGLRTACGDVGRPSAFADSYRATCTKSGCLEAWTA